MLVDRAAVHAGRVLLVVARGQLIGWRWHGYSGDPTDARTVEIAPEIGADRVRRGPEVTATGDGQDAVAVPLRVEGHVVAVLYADAPMRRMLRRLPTRASPWPEVVGVLARHGLDASSHDRRRLPESCARVRGGTVPGNTAFVRSATTWLPHGEVTVSPLHVFSSPMSSRASSARRRCGDRRVGAARERGAAATTARRGVIAGRAHGNGASAPSPRTIPPVACADREHPVVARVHQLQQGRASARPGAVRRRTAARARVAREHAARGLRAVLHGAHRAAVCPASTRRAPGSRRWRLGGRRAMSLMRRGCGWPRSRSCGGICVLLPRRCTRSSPHRRGSCRKTCC